MAVSPSLLHRDAFGEVPGLVDVAPQKAGEVVGEMAYLHPSDPIRTATVVTLEPTLFLEINSAALDLSSDEVVERFRQVLIARVLKRLNDANRALAKLGQSAVVSRGSGSLVELALAPP